jgi:hypothetical protein
VGFWWVLSGLNAGAFMLRAGGGVLAGDIADGDGSSQ